MQASQMHTILHVAVLLWLHQVTVSQDSVLEDAREGQWDRHSLRHNTSRLHAALPCMPSKRQPATTQAEMHGQTTCLCRQTMITNCRKLSYVCSLADNSLLPCHPMLAQPCGQNEVAKAAQYVYSVLAANDLLCLKLWQLWSRLGYDFSMHGWHQPALCKAMAATKQIGACFAPSSTISRHVRTGQLNAA